MKYQSLLVLIPAVTRLHSANGFASQAVLSLPRTYSNQQFTSTTVVTNKAQHEGLETPECDLHMMGAAMDVISSACALGLDVSGDLAQTIVSDAPVWFFLLANLFKGTDSIMQKVQTLGTRQLSVENFTTSAWGVVNTGLVGVSLVPYSPELYLHLLDGNCFLEAALLPVMFRGIGEAIQVGQKLKLPSNTVSAFSIIALLGCAMLSDSIPQTCNSPSRLVWDLLGTLKASYAILEAQIHRRQLSPAFIVR